MNCIESTFMSIMSNNIDLINNMGVLDGTGLYGSDRPFWGLGTSHLTSEYVLQKEEMENAG